MDVKIECAECIVKRVIKEVSLATSDPDLQFNVVREILKTIFNKFDRGVNPARLGTLKDKLIKELTNNKDYYQQLKKDANIRALTLTDELRRKISPLPSEYQRFRTAALSAIAGNAMEFFISGNEFNIEDLDKIQENTERELAIDDIRKFYDFVKERKPKVLYLTDNAGEIAFDTLLVEQIEAASGVVTVAVRKYPVMNDATMEDAELVGMKKYASNVITTGSGSIGLILDDCSKEFIETLENSDILVAKGMGYYETLGDVTIEKPIMLLLRSKCKPIANAVGVELNKNIAKLVESSRYV